MTLVVSKEPIILCYSVATSTQTLRIARWSNHQKSKRKVQHGICHQQFADLTCTYVGTKSYFYKEHQNISVEWVVSASVRVGMIGLDENKDG
jgi:hypothetical protein